ncbi:MAG TPA: hypothetical protein VIO16_10660 [Dehalococcoidia bacterium]
MSGSESRADRDPLQMFGIEGKVIVVTGPAPGIGRVVAEAMVKFGAKVIAADTNPEVSRVFGASHDPPAPTLSLGMYPKRRTPNGSLALRSTISAGATCW